MIQELIKLANKLDAIGQYEIADELDSICREAAEYDVDRIRELMRQLQLHESERFEEGEDKEDRREPVPEEKLKPLFHGKKEDIDPGEELSEEDLPDKYLETRVEDIEDYRDPERDLLSEFMEPHNTIEE